MALTQQDLEQAFAYVMGKGLSIQGLTDGGTDLSRMYLAPVLKYNTGGTAATLVRLAVSLLKGDTGKSAFEQWKEEPGNSNKTITDFFASMKGEKGDRFLFSDFTDEHLADLALTYEKLTPDQKEEMKLHFSDLSAADIAVLEKPATDAAAEVRKEMVQISEDVNQTREKLVEDAGKVNTDLTTAVKGLEERAGTVISETNTVKEAAEEAVINADNATAAANGAAGLANTAAKDTNKATELAVVAAKLAGEKAEQASASADKADTAAGAADDAAALANEKATLANNAAGVADTATGKANTAIGNAETATKRANDAAAAAENIVSGIRPDWAAGKESPNYIKNKPEIPTLQVAPGTDTINYVNTDGTLTTYRIGDEVRVLEDDEYVFYRLYDLSEDVASWQESGSGTALPGNIYLQGATYYNESVRIIKKGYLNE